VWKDGATAVLMTKQVLPRPRSVPWWAVVRRALLDLPAGAALFARFFAGQDPKQVPVMKVSADLLLATSDPKDPWGAYWTTYALFQMGGRHWVEWNRRIDGDIVQTQIRDGELKGSWEPAGGLHAPHDHRATRFDPRGLLPLQPACAVGHRARPHHHAQNVVAEKRWKDSTMHVVMTKLRGPFRNSPRTARKALPDARSTSRLQ
jgi:hypothetical protein